jgi:hypothetical protein
MAAVRTNETFISDALKAALGIIGGALRRFCLQITRRHPDDQLVPSINSSQASFSIS